MGTKHEQDGFESDQVHVRTLGVGDTVRWSFETLTNRLELVGLVFVVNLFSLVLSTGISRPSPTGVPQIESWVWPLYVVYAVAGAILWGVVYRTAGNAVENRSESLGDQITAVAWRVPALFGTAILSLLVVVIGLVFFVIPGIYLFHRLLLAYPAVVIDGEGPIGALKRSWSAAGGNVLKVFALSLLYYVLFGVSSFVVTMFGQFTLQGGLVNVILNAGLLPLFALALGHLYLEFSRNQ